MYKFFTTLILSTLLVSQTETYKIDMIHSKIGFSIGYAGGVIDAEGRFHKFNGIINYDKNDLSQLSTNITINVESIDTGMEFRDKDLRSPNWFDVKKYPKITFTSTSFKTHGNKYQLHGKFTMHGYTKDIVIDVKPTLTEPKLGPGRFYIGFTGEMILNRQDYKVHTSDPERSFWKYNDVMQSTGEMFVADEVKVELKILGVRSGPEIAADLFAANDVDNALDNYIKLKESNPNKLFMSERDLNGIGYSYLEKDVTNAIEIFEKNVELYPNSANVYDSLADGYLKNNQKTEAKEMLQKGIQLAGDNRRFGRVKKAMEAKLNNL